MATCRRGPDYWRLGDATISDTEIAASLRLRVDAVAQKDRDLRAVAAAEAEFESFYADGVDDRSALEHADAMASLRARGVTEPTEADYLAALAAETTLPDQAVHDPDPNVHQEALSVLREIHAEPPVTQDVYDAAAREARRRIREGGRWPNRGVPERAA